MTLVLLLIGVAVVLAAAMAAAWAVAVRTGNNGWADAFWSFSVGIVGAVAVLVPLDAGDPMPRAFLVATLAAVWSLRLGTHILRRTLRGGDDPRYAQLRQDWGDNWRSQLLLFLEIQAACGFVLVVALLAAAHNPAPVGLFDALGVLIALVAIVGEAVSDAQLKAFRDDPANKGKVCDIGLWSLSRHPNYFFEWLYWVAYVVIGFGYGWGWLTLAAPLLMYVLLVHASGIPPLEAHMLRSRPEAFRAYQARVRAFWPLPRR